MVYKRFHMPCEKWKVRFLMRDVKTESDLARFVAKRFSHMEILMLIVDKLELLQENPFKYAREKLKNKLDKYGNPMFSIEVTKDIRILYSVDSENCLVFIWEIGSHKDVYGRD
jgi:mRNA-degrading endonuclease RelE of RelBE toxin-antitoxin system